MCCKNVGYSTVKTVKIYDPLLTTLHYAFMIAIFVYIVVIQVIQKNGYLEFEQPTGTVRLSVQPPTVDQCDPDDPGCHFDYQPTTSLPYCKGYTGQDVAKTTADCVYMGAMETNFPVTGGSPFYVSTRIRESNQTLVCREPSNDNDHMCQQTYEYACYDSFIIDKECKATNTTTENCWGNEKKGGHCWAQRSYFIPQVEDFTLLLDHAVRTTNGVSAAGNEMNGLLKFCNGTEVVPTFTSNGLGFYVIKDLLEGATIGSKDPTPSTCGLRLDDASVVSTSYKSARYDGLVLQIDIEYTNTNPWSGILRNNLVNYVLKASIVNDTKSKVEEEIWYKYPHNRVTRDRHGIKIIVLQTGRLGNFSAAALLTTITSSLALLAVATTAVDFLAMYVLARKHIYKSAKYENINEKYLEKKEREEALLEEAKNDNEQRWDYGTGSETFRESRITPKPSDKDDDFQWK